MGDASYTQPNFLGGEISKLAQGRIDLPTYRTCMNVCLNGHPVESGAWVRRPGTANAGATRGGAAGRVIRFDFEDAVPYTLEFTDGYLRFRQGTRWATTNDAVAVSAISTASPAVVTTGTQAWSTGNTVTFSAAAPTLLQNRQFTWTEIGVTSGSIADAITGSPIDGSTLGSMGIGVTLSRIQELVTPYAAGSWATLTMVQAETSMVLLHPSVPPQILTVTTLPSIGVDAQFSITPIVFLDGPYLDPFTNGVIATPGGTSGSINLTLSFTAYSSTKAYKVGDFVTSSSVNYISLVDDNVNNTPASSPSQWATTSVNAAINNGNGFSATDLGRLVRLLSEPAAWASGTTYASGAVVSYNPTNQPGAATYWTSAAGSNTGNIPGNNLAWWTLTPSNAAVWSWGRITTASTAISGTLSGIAYIGNMSNLSVGFNGASPPYAPGGIPELDSTTSAYIGANYTGASAQKIAQGIVYPGSFPGLAYPPPGQITLTLYGSQSAPSNGANGTVLGTATIPGNTIDEIVIVSSDQSTSWNYAWVNIVTQNSTDIFVGQLTFYSPAGTGTGSGCTIELLGPPLLYTNPVATWRLGVYSGTTGYPSCGCYHEGRLWLGGAVSNRFDASVSNGISGDTINFAPTDQNGVVGSANGISEVFNSDGVNPIQWMMPDLQGIIMGTIAGEWLVEPLANGAMAPNNIAGRRVTKIGGAAILPVRTEHTTVFVQRYQRKLMEYFADVYSGKFTAPNLAANAMHITEPGVSELAYTQAVTPILWARNADGSWFGVTYKRDTLSTSSGPTYAAFHPHALGSGRTVTSICSGPSVDGTRDALTMVTLDAVSGVYHVEIMTDTMDEGSTLIEAAFLDDAVNPTSTSTSNTSPSPNGGLTLNGLWHLNGETVTAWLGGLDCGDYAVSSGSITVPYGDGVSAGTGSGLFTASFAASLSLSEMQVGFTYNSDGQLVRPATPAESGARNGPAPGKKRRTMQYTALLEGAGYDGGSGGSLSFGTDFSKLYPALFKQPNGTAYTVQQQFSGVLWDMLNDDYSFDSMLCWRISRPYPVNIALVGGFLQTMDK